MFSGYELVVIKSWAKEAKEILKGHLNSKIFTHEEKEDKRREYAALEEIIETTKHIQTTYADLDADHLGHLLQVCEAHGNYVRDLVERAEMTTMDFAQEMYCIGYMQGRAEIGLLTMEDVEVIESWETDIE